MTLETAQQYHTNQVHFLRTTVAYTDDGATLSLGWVPANASIVRGGVVVLTAFDSGTSDVLDIGFRNAGDGTTADPDNYATDLDLTTVGVIVADAIATATGYHAEGAEITAAYVSAGTAPTAGSAYVWVEYLADNS